MNYLVQEWNQSGSLIDSLWLPFSERQWMEYAFPCSIINRKRRMNEESLFTSQRVSERIHRWRESTFISYWTNHMNLFPLVTGQAGRVHSSFGRHLKGRRGAKQWARGVEANERSNEDEKRSKAVRHIMREWAKPWRPVGRERSEVRKLFRLVFVYSEYRIRGRGRLSSSG